MEILVSTIIQMIYFLNILFSYKGMLKIYTNNSNMMVFWMYYVFMYAYYSYSILANLIQHYIFDCANKL